MTFDVVFLRSITAVTNTIDAAQVAQPLKVQLFRVFLYPLLTIEQPRSVQIIIKHNHRTT